MFLIVLPTQTVLLDHPVQEKTHIFIIVVITLIYTPASSIYTELSLVGCDICHLQCILAVHDCFKHAAGQDIFLLDWNQVLSYDVSLLNSGLVVNSVINLVQFSYNLK
jgi:hypothetical protein